MNVAQWAAAAGRAVGICMIALVVVAAVLRSAAPLVYGLPAAAVTGGAIIAGGCAVIMRGRPCR